MLMALLVLLFSLLSATWFWPSATAVIVWLPFFTPAVSQFNTTGGEDAPTGSAEVGTVPMVVLPSSTKVVLDAPAFASPWFLIVAVMGIFEPCGAWLLLAVRFETIKSGNGTQVLVTGLLSASGPLVCRA